MTCTTASRKHAKRPRCTARVSRNGRAAVAQLRQGRLAFLRSQPTTCMQTLRSRSGSCGVDDGDMQTEDADLQEADAPVIIYFCLGAVFFCSRMNAPSNLFALSADSGTVRGPAAPEERPFLPRRWPRSYHGAAPPSAVVTNIWELDLVARAARSDVQSSKSTWSARGEAVYTAFYIYLYIYIYVYLYFFIIMYFAIYNIQCKKPCCVEVSFQEPWLKTNFLRDLKLHLGPGCPTRSSK